MLRKDLPKTFLRDVSRDDVKRVMNWIEDEEISESWFGRYNYGDPAHLGYDPKKMIDSSETEWDRTFNDPNHEPHRTILSINNENDEHIGYFKRPISEEPNQEYNAPNNQKTGLDVLVNELNQWSVDFENFRKTLPPKTDEDEALELFKNSLKLK